MADAQGFIQPLAQANTPSSVNNGNPNTVYNTPQTGAPRPLQGWTIQQPVAANINTGNVAQEAINQSNQMIQDKGWMAPQVETGFNGPKLTTPEGWVTPTAPTTANPNPTPTTPAPTAPAQVDTSSWQWVVMNGKVPGMNTQLYNTDPAYKAAWDQTAREHHNQFKKSYTKDSSPQAITDRLKALYQQFSAGTPQQAQGQSQAGASQAAGWTSGNGGADTQAWVNNLMQGGVPVMNANKGWASQTAGDPAKVSQAVDGVLSTFTNLGSKFNSSSALQLLDAITEPFIPGNFFMSELGSVNGPNVMKAILNQAMPGVGTLAQKILGAIPDSATGFLGKMRDWIKEGKFDELANDVFKGVRKDTQQKVSTGSLDASLGWGGSSGGGWMLGSGLGGGGVGSVTVGGGGGGGGGHGKIPEVTIGKVDTSVV